MKTAIEQVRATSTGTHPIQFSLLRLKNWPNLPQSPAEEVVDLARICALLSWRATAGVIIARLLDLPKERVQDILLQLHSQDCLQILDQPLSAPAAQAEPGATPESYAQAGNSLITKIWQRLAART